MDSREGQLCWLGGADLTMHWNHHLVEQLDWYWRMSFRPRLEGLSDEEYLWEPTPGCWTVRRVGPGRYRPDWQWPPPSPPPVTTIAWRICHIGGPVLGLRANSHFGDGALTVETLEWPGTAAAAIAFVDREYAAWKADQVNGAVQAKIDQAIEEANRALDGMADSTDALTSFAAGVRARRYDSGSSCEALLADSFYPSGSGGRDVKDSRAYADGQRLGHYVRLARELKRCFLPVPNR